MIRQVVFFGVLLISGAAFSQEITTVTVAQDVIVSETVEESSSYAGSTQLRGARRMGIGTDLRSGAGLGVHMELNMEDQDGVQIGFGFGVGFSNFSMAWKHSFEGGYLAPYTTLGGVRYFGSSGENPSSYVLDTVLSDEEQLGGQFGADFLTAAVGVQYNQLDGEFQGGSLFGEIQLLGSFRRPLVIPVVAVGATYFF